MLKLIKHHWQTAIVISFSLLLGSCALTNSTPKTLNVNNNINQTSNTQLCKKGFVSCVWSSHKPAPAHSKLHVPWQFLQSHCPDKDACYMVVHIPANTKHKVAAISVDLRNGKVTVHHIYDKRYTLISKQPASIEVREN